MKIIEVGFTAGMDVCGGVSSCCKGEHIILKITRVEYGTDISKGGNSLGASASEIFIAWHRHQQIPG